MRTVATDGTGRLNFDGRNDHYLLAHTHYLSLSLTDACLLSLFRGDGSCKQLESNRGPVNKV